MSTGGKLMSRRLGFLVAALPCGALSLWLALHHPLSPAMMVAACVGIAALVFARFDHWPAWLLPMLPVSGLMPWTGWLVVEEWDLLVLSAAAAGYARLAGPVVLVHTRSRPGALAWVALVPLVACTLYAMTRGVANAGGWAWGWWQGYRDPLNSLRLAKPVLEVVLLLPLWQAISLRDDVRSARALGWGMTGLAATAALPVWWERLAFTDLLNFSTDYRATGLFWEMHVGGAALDAAMALSLPFALLALVRASNARTWVVAAVACALALYASIVTFSRIVYLAVPAILALGGLLYLRQSRRPEVGYGSLWAATVLVCAVAAAAAWLFPVAGYRGELALLGSFALMLVAAGLRPLPGASVVLSLVVVSAVTICALAVPKGAYIAYASCLLAGAVLAARTRRSVSAGVSSALMAAFVGSVAGLVAVSWHWGGDHAAMRAAPVAAVLLAWPIAAARWPRLQGPATWQWRSQAVLAAAAAVGVVAVFSGGRYMEERVNSVSQDSVGRQRHVGLLLGMLTSPDQTAFGFGLGRTPAQLAASGASDLRVGDARVLSDGEGAHLVMASGTHTQGWGEMLRVSQRIGRPASGLIRLQLRLRTDQALSVHAEVCDKHLLYDGRCKIAAVELKDVQLGWRQLELELKGSELEPGRWFAPRLTVFSLALDYLGARAEIDDLRLSDSRGQTLLDNGDFQQGMRRWFITSDRHHLPWHAKNLVAHLWFEQGLISVALVAVAMLAAVWRTGVGRSARHPLAPALAASLVGLCIVGLVDSIFDMPRIGFLTFWLLAVALSLPTGGPSSMRSLRP